MPDGAERWFADVSAWTPESSEWQRAAHQLPPHEQQEVARFVFAKDQRLALGSRLLQRRLVAAVSSSPAPLSLELIDLRRTRERKPFWYREGGSSSGGGATSVPLTWNFNVSHHGTLVVVASHPRRLVGVDVVQLSERPRSGRARDFFRAFERHFTAREWEFIRAHDCGCGDAKDSAVSNDTVAADDGQFERFYMLWALKEAYIKAVGIGLGFELLRAEFVFSDAQQRWQLYLDGALASDWSFEATRLDAVHLVSVALGPLSAATSSIFPPCVRLEEMEASDASADAFDGQWERKELADLIA